MTNTPSGSKRPWDSSADAEQESHKRPREKDDTRDWRDVHLSSRRKSSYSRRDSGDYSRQSRDSHPSSRSRGYDTRPHSATSYSRDLRNGSNRDREPDYDRTVDHRSSRDHTSFTLPNGRGVDAKQDSTQDSEREEGE
jgi:serine/threonine-protein kinase PRP4